MSRHVLSCVLMSLCALAPAACGGGGGASEVERTVATVEPVRPSVTVAEAAAPPLSRVVPGTTLETSDSGLTRISLDGGGSLLLGGAGRLVVHDGTNVELGSGLLFADTEGEERLTIRTARGEVGTSDGSLSVRIAGPEISLYVVRGEVGYEVGDDHGVVHAGEQLVIGENGPDVAPANVWSDWTGGLARPGLGDDLGPAGMGTLEARVPDQVGTARHPLVVEQLAVRVELRGDLAVTEVDQVFHNPGDETVEGLYRVRTPEGAVLERFAIDRNGQLIEGYVRERHQARESYQSQVYRGSTEDPALLEWDAPGAYRARIYPIGPGQRRRIVVRYAEWLSSPGATDVRHYRYPMGQGSRPPYIESFSLTADLSEANAREIRAGMGATVDGDTVRLRRNDFRPRSDFWLDIAGGGHETGSLVAYRARHTPPRRAPDAPAPVGEEDERDYYFIPLVLPEELSHQAEHATGLDLVVVADVSAATDPAHLELGQAMVEALAAHLGPEDRIAVVASDLTLRAVIDGDGGAELGPANAERLDQLLTGLARVGAGGATDLGAAITAAGDLLDPNRRGAVVYVGDGAPTVGELQTEDLLERMDRLPSHARLYAVAVGADANLDLLAALARDRGLAMRIEERRAAAESALRVLAHLSRPMARGVTIDVGAGIENVYPAGPADVVLGDVLPVLGRVAGSLPTRVRVSGSIDGEEFTQELDLSTETIDDSGDLRLRWSSERLRNLLVEGVPRETVVELGTRYGLITPYTSFYVPSASEAQRMGLSSLLRPLDVEPRRGSKTGQSALRSLAMVIAAPLAMAGCGRDEEESAAVAVESADQTWGQSALKAAAPPSAPSPLAAPVEEATAEDEAEPAAEPPPPPEATAVAEGPGISSSQGRSRGGDDEGRVQLAREPARAAQPQQHSGVNTVGASDRVAVDGPVDDGFHLAGQIAIKSAGPGAPRAASKSRGRPGVNRRFGRKRTVVDEDEMTEVPDTAPPEHEVTGEDRHEAERAPSKSAHQLARCSPASELPLEDRRTLWSERLGAAGGPSGWVAVYRRAISDCETVTWRDRSALLDLIVRRAGSMESLISVYRSLASTGAGPYLRRSILARVRTPADLVPVRAAFGGGDVEWRAIEDRLSRDESADVRIAFLRQLVGQHPGNFDIRLRLLSALEEASRIPEALRLAQELRSDRLADAEVRTAIGELLLRHDQEGEARRVFSEMVEFAPYDALARRRLGDLYRAHGWYDDAYRQYQTLAEIRPDDPTVQLLLAAAAAGAGRVDEALRLERGLAESPEPGSTGGLARVAVFSSSVRLAKLRRTAREAHDEEQLRVLTARMRRSAVLREASALRVTLTWAHPHAGLSLWGAHPNLSLSRPPDVWPDLGIEVFDVEDLESGEYRIEVRRESLDLSTPVDAELVIVWGEGTSDEQITILPLRFEGDQRVLAWTITGRELAEAVPVTGAGEEVL